MDNQVSKKTVLIVDDTPENVDVLRGILSQHYRIQVATNGRLALKIAFSPAPPDLILLDVMMPELDGYETCRLLKKDDRTSDIPVLFVTAKSDVKDETHGLSIGAADYLVKPVSPPIVLARVKTHLAINDKRKLLQDQVEARTAQLQERSKELFETRVEVIRQLGRAAEYRDNETGMHVIRMSRFVRLLALKSGLSQPEADQIMYASMMHDIGKIGIPDTILLKPGKLTNEEFDIIKSHPEIGHNIIGKQQANLLSMGGLIALSHHEKWNGRGYPNGLAGEEIPLVGRFCAIGDVFDALTSIRPYKKAWSVDDALKLIIDEAGEHFDPKLAQMFVGMKSQIVEIMEKYKEN
ncbi:MAG: two-component system response regulator [Magnetococcales bacterium]|nr:two-component system response regulator [Magnetococcales bacterium]